MSADVQVLFEELVAERGGPQALTLIEKALARRLAQLLASEDLRGRSVETVAQLASLLPPKIDGPSPDLSRLTDQEQAYLEQLLARACGEIPPTQEPRTERSHRFCEAVHLARVLDDAEAAGDNLSEAQRFDVMASIGAMLWPLTIPSHLWSPDAVAPSSIGQQAATPS